MSSPKLTEAFKIMRKKGLIARQRFQCCRTCAGYELGTILDDLIDKEKPMPQGGVYYTKQDAECFRDTGKGWLSFGLIENKDKKTPLSTLDVGKIVCEALSKVGLKFEWDEDPNLRIQVIL